MFNSIGLIVMHALPNARTVRRFQIAALLLLLKWLLVIVFVALFGYSLMWEKRELTCLALYLMGLCLLVSVSHWVISARARCPWCLVPSFSHQQCSKYRKARHFLGSYRLFVTLGVIFRGWFRCPYCGEPTAVAVRKHPRGVRG